MKARIHQGAFAGKVEPLCIPKAFEKEPKNHAEFVWESQDGRKTNIKLMDDSHLKNLYNMLVRTIYFTKQCFQSKIIESEDGYFRELLIRTLESKIGYTLEFCMNSLLYIGHEMYLRFYNPAYDDNELSKTLAEIQQKNYY